MTVCQTCHGNGYLRHDDNALCPDCIVPDEVPQPQPDHHPLPREVAIETARALITGDRHRAYGPAERNLQSNADLWSFYTDTEIDAVQAANMMALMKIARMKADAKKEDNYFDAIGYLALAYELAQSNDD